MPEDLRAKLKVCFIQNEEKNKCEQKYGVN